MKFNWKRYYLLFIFIILTAGCSIFGNSAKNSLPGKVESGAPAELQTSDVPTLKVLHQWASSARASSEYSSPNWAAMQAVGKPDVKSCGDNTSAWASRGDNTVEWIELTYPTPVVPTEINIYQSYNPSQVVEVMMIATDGQKYSAWEGYPESVKNCPDLMTIIPGLEKKIAVNKIRITIDQQVNGWGWNEIDAVELVGTRP